MATKYWIASTASSFQGGTGVWSDSAAPANGDTLVFGAYGTGNCNAGLTNSLTTVTIIVEPGYTGQIGTVSSGVATPLTLDGGTINIVADPNQNNASSGSQRLLFAFGASAGTVNIQASNSSGAEPSIPSVCVTGTSLAINMTGGNLGVAVRPGETSTITTLTLSVGRTTPYLMLGRGVTGTNCDAVNGGTVLDMRTNLMKSIRNYGQGKWDYTGTGATTTVYLDGGTLYYTGTGTITTVTQKAGELNFARSAAARTVTNAAIDGGTLNLDNGSPGAITFTNPITFPSGMDAVTILTPNGVKANIQAI